MHASELYIDEVDAPLISEDEVEFLVAAYSVIKTHGEDLHNYTEKELFQVHAMLVVPYA